MNHKASICSCVVFLLLVIIDGCVSDWAMANPYIGRISPPAGTKPPTITLFSPDNNTIIASDNVFLIFNVSTAETQNAKRITEVYFVADWLEGNTSLYYLDMTNPDYAEASITEFFKDETLTEIPDGNHNVTLVATAEGFFRQGFSGFYFNISGYSTINFTVDTTSPRITTLSVENKTYNSNRITLNFCVDEPASWMGYSLDNELNITLSGNATLNVQAGLHKLTIYANDTAGNMGNSKTVEFTFKPNQPTLPATPSPSPTQQPTATPTSLIAVYTDPAYLTDLYITATIVISVIIAVAGVAVYLKKKGNVR